MEHMDREILEDVIARAAYRGGMKVYWTTLLISVGFIAGLAVLGYAAYGFALSVGG